MLGQKIPVTDLLIPRFNKAASFYHPQLFSKFQVAVTLAVKKILVKNYFLCFSYGKNGRKLPDKTNKVLSAAREALIKQDSAFILLFDLMELIF